MAGNETYSLRYKQTFNVSTVCYVLFISLLVAGLMLNSPPHNESRMNKALSSVFDNTGVSPSRISVEILSDKDKQTYREIFAAQKSTDWHKADELISKLDNTLLLGDVLAERFLHRHYETSASEIIDWLKQYSDHVQTADMVELGNIKYPTIFSHLPKIEKRRLQGYGDANRDEVRFEDNPNAKKLWQFGLEAWRSGKFQDAANYFVNLAEKQNGLSEWQTSAANFWAYRSYKAIGNGEKANFYLTKAAADSYSFYGILANKHLGNPLKLDTRPIDTSDMGISKFLDKSKIQRIIALSEAGFNERAESQIRALFPSATKNDKWAFLYLAYNLSLPSVQISMARQLETKERGLDLLKYPIPEWKPEGGYRVDPYFIYALMRQESGFHSAAISSGGATGLMQLMPKTAQKMKTPDILKNNLSSNISEPVLNITLGERYIEHLLGNDLVGGNLLYMLAAYNAGIGRLKDWQNSIDYKNDPLLFVESIPFSETRYYVMQVMSNYWIYSELAGNPTDSIFALLKNNWPSYASLN